MLVASDSGVHGQRAFVDEPLSPALTSRSGLAIHGFAQESLVIAELAVGWTGKSPRESIGPFVAPTSPPGSPPSGRHTQSLIRVVPEARSLSPETFEWADCSFVLWRSH